MKRTHDLTIFSGGRAFGARLLAAAGLLLPLSLSLSTPAQGQEPEWWTDYSVLSGTAQDYSAVNVGQVKYLASKAKEAMDANLFDGAGPEIDGLISGWQSAPAPNNYAAATLGQLKHVGKVFHDRLAEDGLVAPGTYPWSGFFPQDDYAMAVSGQAKKVFSFEVEPQVFAEFHLYRIEGDATSPVAQAVPVSATAAGAATVEYEVLRYPEFGTLDVSSAPAYMYEPDAGFTGVDFFVYRAKVAGSTSESSAAQVSLLVKEHAGAVTLVHPAPGKQIVEGDGVTFVVDAFKATAKVTSVEFYADDVKIGSAGSDTLDVFTWLNPSVGSHTVKSVAYFDDATSATSATHAITILANAAPTVTLTFAPNPHGSTAPVAANAVLVKAQTSDATPGDKVKRVQFFLDGVLIGDDTVPGVGASAGLFEWRIEQPMWAGVHTVKAVAVDSHGKTSQDEESFTISGNHAPEVEILTPVHRQEIQVATGEGTVDIPVEIAVTEADALDDVASVVLEVTRGANMVPHETTLDGGVYKVTLEDVEPGAYYLRAKATDDSTAAAEGWSPVVKVLVLADGQVPPSALLAEITGANVTTENLDFIGNVQSATTFTGGRYFSIESNAGTLLTSGALKWKGPNVSTGFSGGLRDPGDADLELLVVDDDGKRQTFDAVGLEFDFTPTKAKVEISLQFASEEYTEFSPGGSEEDDFNDLFAIYVDGVNIARVPGSRSAPEGVDGKIGVDSINSKEVLGAMNPGDNRQLYCNNEDDSLTVEDEIYFKTEYDGFTYKITAMATVTPNEAHHMKIVIADAIDEALDSGLFLKRASFRSVDP